MNRARHKLMASCAALLCFKFIDVDYAAPFAAGAALLTYRWLPRLQTDAEVQQAHRGILELPLALDVLALGLDSGLSWDRATNFAADCCTSFLAVDLHTASARLAMGAAADEVWVGSATLVHIGEVVDRSFRSGGTVSVLLRQHADALRAAERLRRIEKSRRLGTTILLPLTFIGIPAFMVLAIVPILATNLMNAFAAFT